MDNIPYLVSLHKIPGLGFSRITYLLKSIGDPKLIWEASSSQLRKLKLPQDVILELEKARKEVDPEKYFEDIISSGIKITTFFDEDYPDSLKEISSPPLILYYKGRLPRFARNDNHIIGIVGTRKMTSYGKRVTEQFTKELVDAGFLIVSGLARGVDTCAHTTTLKNNGITIAILGGGLKNIYPVENKVLSEQIAESGGTVISEFPPSYQSLPGNFPARNRIIAAISQAVLVTEADADSGSLITARFAAEFGKDVFAIPGPITSQLSKGPIELIQQGAKAVYSASDIFDEMGISRLPSKKVKDSEINNLPEDQRQILELLSKEEVHIDDLSRSLNVQISDISSLLIRMEIAGLIKNIGNGVYVRI